ncbi:MAG: aldose 1-epimerase [Actinomycetota bacterium]|nr:aldose 1-epimerase [Actinomycetota bacterium]
MTPGRFGHESVAIVEGDGCVVTIAHRGATLLRWVHSEEALETDLSDGYANAAELIGQNGVRNGILAPFPNRIALGRYEFAGSSYDLLPGQPDEDRLIYHGFLRKLPTNLTNVQTRQHSAELTFACDAIRPGAFAGYPFALDVRVVYEITASSIDLTVHVHNVGGHAAPYAAGWHPYFRLGTESINELELTIPAQSVIRTTPDLIPLSGAEAHGLPETDAPDFRQVRPIGEAVLDTCYTDLVADHDGISRTLLSNPRTGQTLEILQESGHMHVFTGDTLGRDQRRSIALEPVEVTTNSFNRAELVEHITLAPDSHRFFRCGVRYKTALA